MGQTLSGILADMPTAEPEAPGRLSDHAIETGKLIVELLNSGYASRRSGTAASPGSARPHVSPHAIRAAIHLYQHGELTVGQLGRDLGISRGWASRVVEELDLAGYLERERRLDDRRVVKIRLRPASVEEVERAYRWRGDAVEAALAPFDDAERAVIQRFLRRVVDEMRAAAPGATVAAGDAAGEDSPGPDD
jgi:DNA-binding MarR family transcriptional regulator